MTFAGLRHRLTEFLPPLAVRTLRLARTEAAALGAFLVMAMSGLLFLDLAEEMAEQGDRGLDYQVLEALRVPGDVGNPIGPWWVEEAAADLTSLGGISVLSLFTLLAVTHLLLQRHRGAALRLVLGLIGAVGLSEGLKSVFERERPPVAYQAVETLNASFPSGHALLATVFYLSLGTLVAQGLTRRREKIWVLGAAVLLALTVGLTRVYLGAHWLSDVLAGWCVGAAWAMSLWLAAWALERYGRHREARLARQAPPA
ncbi:MAG: phosphatase PAP2 family protein [Brevundimonas sp.]|uniref:phosphatase PAP2 family protein n=1 Tax=Brevundimonas sp. TaxID=1871086 RepID=UPI0030025B0F